MTPEGRPWTYTPAPAISLVLSQPLYQTQVLQAVSAVTVPALATTQPTVAQFFRETKKHVQRIAPKPGARTKATQESYCKTKKRAEWKTKTKRSHPKVEKAKMREEFVLKPDGKLLREVRAESLLSGSGDEDVEMPRLELQVQPHQSSRKPDTVKTSGRKVKRISEEDCDGSDIIKSLQKQIEGDDSDLELFVAKETDSEESGEAAFEKLLTSDSSKRRRPPGWTNSPTKRDRVSPRGAHRSPGHSSLAIVTTPWGVRSSSFDLSEDYVNDYLKDKAKTDSTKSPDPLAPTGLLMVSPPTASPTARRAASRAVSMDVIPACLPDSVGAEIGDILRGGFLTISPPAPRTPRRRGRNAGRSSPQKNEPARDKMKNSRKKSTEDLPPNLLPEDYLDEVIGQYFNADSSSEEDKRVEEITSKPAENSDSEESTEESSNNEGGKKARSRPPASFFSMDFLDEPAHTDNATEKVKTDLEIEKEYRHILYGGKKRKAPKINVTKKKKTSPHKEERLHKKSANNRLEKLMSSKQKNTRKHKPEAILREANGKSKLEEDASPVRKPVPVSRAKSPAKEQGPPVKEERRGGAEVSWKGKKANSAAYDRSAMLQHTSRRRPNVSAKIEDVTGRYSKEEELAACGICEMLDPPADPTAEVEVEVEWVGCDCLRWFHKGCTTLTKISEKFSCKSVKMKCLAVEAEEEEPEPETSRIAILKFCRDRDTMFIEDVML